MKRYIIFITVVLLGIIHLEAQQEMPDRKGKFFLVPEFWLSFGSTTYIEVAPLLGYHLNNRLSVGLGPHYIFQSWRNPEPLPPTQTHAYGLKGFARFAIITNAEQFLPINLFSELFAHMEYEVMSLESDVYHQQGDEGRFIYHAFLVGGGLSQRIGIYNSFSFMVLWDLNETSSSPYSNPIFRIGFNTYF